MIIVTGGAGLIGSAVVWKLNGRGVDDILIVDHNPDGDKDDNLAALKYSQYIDKSDFLQKVFDGRLSDSIESIIHLGACTDTTKTDKEYLYQNNFDYTRKLASYAVNNKIRFIYASSAATYGNGEKGYADDEKLIPALEPLNEYARSKQMFDLWATENDLLDKIAGLKYFNIFGPNEGHKGEMRSMVAKAFEQIWSSGEVRLYKSHREEYEDGEQQRDFLYVKDAAEITLFFLDNPALNGIYNIGSGRAESWNVLTNALFEALDLEPKIRYIDMPGNIREQYQYHTRAETDKLIDSGYQSDITPLVEAIRDYVTNYLIPGSHLGS